MTFANLKKAVAATLGVGTSDLTVDSLDLSVVAANAVRQQAEQLNDFEFNRKLLSMTVNTSTGGSLSTAVLYGTATVADIKTIIEVGQADDYGNFIPIDWTTVAESIERYRAQNGRYRGPHWLTDGEAEAGGAWGSRRVMFSGDTVAWFPKPETGSDVTLLLEAYCYTADWTGAETGSGDVWLTKGWNYLLWASVVWLNHSENNVFGKKFVPRTEGNLPPPQQLADTALASFITNDNGKFEIFRRHGR